MSNVSSIVETNSGFLALDASSKLLKQFDMDGKFVGAVDCDRLFGTSLAWMACMIPSADGGVMIAAVQPRQDESADELLLFHVAGF